MSNLPATLTSLAAGLQASAQEVEANDVTFMKCAKGEWLYGAEETICEPDATWAIHPEYLVHGWVAWGDEAHDNRGTLQGEKMVPAGQPKPVKGGLAEVQAEWVSQYGIQMLCLSGFDLGLAVMYKTSSYGGGKVFKKLLGAIVAKIQSGSPEICPVLMLSSSDYKHKSYGKVYNPEIEIVDWITIETLGETAGTMAAEDHAMSEQVDMIAGDDGSEIAEMRDVEEAVDAIEKVTKEKPVKEKVVEEEPAEERPKRAARQRKAKPAAETVADKADTAEARKRPARARRS